MTKARDLANLIAAGNPLSDGAISVAEISDLTASAAELNNVAGINSSVQTQLDSKASATDLTTAIAGLGTAAALDVGTGVQAYNENLNSFVNAFTLPTSDGTADQILKTDGSGTIAFSDAGGGGAQFDFTAEGSITAGNVVSLTNTGKVAVSLTDAIGSLQEYSSGVSYTSGSNAFDIAACPRTGRMLLTLAQASGGRVELIGVTETGGTFTFGSVSTFSGDAEGVSVVPTGRVDGEFVVCYRKTSTRYLAARIVDVSSTRVVTRSGLYYIYTGSDITLDPGSAVLASPSNTSEPSILVLHEFNNGGYPEACASSIQVSSSKTLSGSKQLDTLSGTGGSGANVSNDIFSTVYDETNNRVFGSFRAQNGNAYIYAFSISGTTITELDKIQFSAAQAIDIAYDGSLNYGVFTGGTAAGTVEVDSFTYDGNSFSRTANPITVQTNGYDARTADMTYDYGKKKFIIRAVKTSGSGYKHWITTGKFDGNGVITLDNPESSANIPFVSALGLENTRHYATHNLYNNTNVLMHLDASNGYVHLYTYTLGNDGNYIGVADATVSNGQTVTINLKGSVDENQTGLSVGSIYFAGNNGSLSGSGSSRVGKALSATALQITD